MDKPIVNIDELEFMDWGHGKRFAARLGLISDRIGARGLGYNLTVVPPGKRAFPFHSHRVNDEMFFVVSGNGQIRIGEHRWSIGEGDVIACPPGGPETAHQIINNSDAELKYLAVSTMQSPEVAEYPDSSKVAVIMDPEPGEDGLSKRWRLMMKSESTQVDYWDDEDAG